ncbi:MAG: oxygen-independent coproporphyrinogen III oxidase, partial [Cyanobacteria bacterium]|nr:oxygen-independent coproporphyrinogen III oxidase [Cyanobacteriota bacterium]
MPSETNSPIISKEDASSEIQSVEIELFQERFTLSAELLNKYSIHGPRYTSYPTAPMWKDDFGADAFESAILGTNTEAFIPIPLSLYVHIPFCESRCLFCGCNVVITKQTEQAEKYLSYLFQEIDRTAKQINPNRQVVQFHWGGGTPTYLIPEQMERLFLYLKERFQLSPQAEIAIEVDPRVTTPEQLQLLRKLGFNRISLGVQDFEPQVMEAIHRIQPLEMTQEMVSTCRTLGFQSLNLDLIYGLPHQTVNSFEKTVAQVIAMAPDRIALYNYAHVPWMAPHQAQMDESTLPQAGDKIQIFLRAIQLLTEAGYVYIGMDHFAKPHDELAIAQQQGTLRRNFMGYTTQAGSELYAFGVSGISGLNGFYAQNWRKLPDYYQAVEDKKLPTMRGYALSQEDLLRRGIISQILCHGVMDYPSFEKEFHRTDLKAYFESENPGLRPTLEKMENDGLLRLKPQGFQLTPLGRILSRNVAMLYDAYLGTSTSSPQSP